MKQHSSDSLQEMLMKLILRQTHHAYSISYNAISGTESFPLAGLLLKFVIRNKYLQREIQRLDMVNSQNFPLLLI